MVTTFNLTECTENTGKYAPQLTLQETNTFRYYRDMSVDTENILPEGLVFFIFRPLSGK